MSTKQPDTSDPEISPKEKSTEGEKSKREHLDDIHSDVSDEYSDDRSWHSEESEYNSESEGDVTADSSETSQQATAPLWSSQPPSDILNIPYTGVPGLKISHPGADPIDFFNLMATDEFYSLIVNETNANVARIRSASGQSPSLTEWNDLTIKELKVFLGILFHMGTMRIEALSQFWTLSAFVGNSFFIQLMSSERFTLIMRALHFSKDPEGNVPPLTAEILKVKPLIDLFNRNMEQIHKPSRELFIGDSMVLRMFNLIFRACIKHKSYRSGMKLYMLNESNGLIQKFLVHSREDDEDLIEHDYAQVVNTLMQEYFDLGHSLFTDSLYNSVDLAKDLLKKKTYCTGALRINRKHNPSDVAKAKLKKGDLIERYSSDNICVLKWKDKGGEALTISTEFNGQMVEVTDKKGITRKKPLAVVKYNQFIRKLNDMEDITSYYPCELVRMEWYKKLFIHIIQTMSVNAYYLFKKCNHRSRMSFYDFRVAVIEELVQVAKTEP